MFLIPRSVVLVFLALAIFVLASDPANAKNVVYVGPSSSPDNATHNILDAINAIRNKGFTDEADQLKKLIDEGNVFYRPSDPANVDAQFIHGIALSPDELYLGRNVIKFVKGSVQRFDKKSEEDQQRLAGLITTLLHEMLHKEQSRISIVLSVERAKARGYKLHEIEAYRATIQKYVRKWVCEDTTNFLKNQEAMDDRKKQMALQRLRAQLYPLIEKKNLDRPAQNGDKACRWNSIKMVVQKLADDQDTLRHDLGSKLRCLPKLPRARQHKQFVIEANLKLQDLRDRHERRKQVIAVLDRSIRADRRIRARLQRQLNQSTLQSHRLQVVDRIVKIDKSLENQETQLADERGEQAMVRSEWESTKAKRSRAQVISKSYDRCRIDYVNKLKLRPSQLPPDMVRTGSGGIKIVAANKIRDVDLKSSCEKLTDMVNYDAGLRTLGIVENDPRTPCYRPQIAKPIRPHIAKPIRQKKCRRGGLLGGMICVEERIDQGG